MHELHGIEVYRPESEIVTPTSQIVPALFSQQGERASFRFVEFFTANIPNDNTRAAYYRAVCRFADWCADRGYTLTQLDPIRIAAYIKALGEVNSIPTVKQHLAAIRMLFDFLVTGGVMATNPATSVKGPKYKVNQGKTPVLTAEEARALLDAIDTTKIAGLRDRALIGLLVYSFARVGAVVAMNVEDYFQKGKRWWIRLHEKGGTYHEMPVHHNAEAYLDAYIEAAGIADDKEGPLFRGCLKSPDWAANLVHEPQNGLISPPTMLQTAPIGA